MSSFKNTLFICLCLVTVVTANPIHTIGGLNSLPAGSCPLPQESTSLSTTSQSNGKHCNPSDQSCKLHCRLQDFNRWSGRLLELAFPIHLAASVIRESYNAILTKANEQWTIHSPIPSVWTRQSNLELSSPSVPGLVPQPVATDSARIVLSATQTGWTGTSNTMYQTGRANQAVGATLQNAENQRSLAPRHLAKPSTISIAERRHLKKRTAPFPMSSFTVHAAIVPVSVAAPYIKTFFDEIAFRASTEWRAFAEKALFTITSGPFQLTVSCLGANIPWHALAAAAEHFSSLADRSWTNTFDVFFTEPETAITIALSLRLLQQARARPAASLTGFHARRTNGHLESRRSPPVPIPPTTHLNPPRTPTLISTPSGPGLKLTHFVRTAAVVPVTFAATKFEDFYNIIAMKIETGQWADIQPSKYICCALWDFELTFYCDKMNVPFSFVQAFAIDMAEWSARQFTGFYEATIMGEGPLAGLIFDVKMGLKSKNLLSDGSGAE